MLIVRLNLISVLEVFSFSLFECGCRERCEESSRDYLNTFQVQWSDMLFIGNARNPSQISGSVDWLVGGLNVQGSWIGDGESKDKQCSKRVS
jgi:hypothetical protein